MKVIKLEDYTKIADSDVFNNQNEYCKNENLGIFEEAVRSVQRKETIIDLLNTSKKGMKILRGEVGDLRTHEWVGLFTTEPIGFIEESTDDENGKQIENEEEVKVFIHSRFDNENCDFTNYLLGKVYNTDARIFKDMETEVGQERALDLMLYMQMISLLEAANKKGQFRAYKEYERNDDKIKGTIDIARHIKSNPLFNGKISYRYRQYTVDNDINKIILTACKFMENRHREFASKYLKQHKTAKGVIEGWSYVMEPASRKEATDLIRKTKKKIANPIYKAWEEVLKIAIHLLKRMGVHIAGENEFRIKGMLINIADMWEKYIELVLAENNNNDEKIEVRARSNKCSEKIFKNTGKLRQSIEPDVILIKPNEDKAVLDCKYKKSWSKSIERRLKENEEQKDLYLRDDIFQVLSYMKILDTKKGGIICPIKESDLPYNEEMKYLVDNLDIVGKESGDDNEEFFYSIYMPIPSDTEGFEIKIRDYEKEVAKQIYSVVNEIKEIKK